MYHQLYQYLDQNKLLSNFQSSFRKSFSTETAVTFLTDNIRRNMDIGLLIGAIYIDLKKAFDTIDHNLLLAKLGRYGIDSQSLKWIDSYLKGGHERVGIDGVLSSPAIIQSSVPQGSIMGPLLFILYINNVPVCINFSKVMLYANDTILYYAAKTGAELELILSLDLNNVAMWMTQNELFLNNKKTEYVIYGTR